MQLVKYYDIFFIKVLFLFLNYLLLQTKKKELTFVDFLYFVRMFNVIRVLCVYTKNVCMYSVPMGVFVYVCVRLCVSLRDT